MINKKNITGLILAGGKSSRMGSDKGLLSLNGSTFIEHIIQTISPFVDEIIIISNNPDYDIYNLKRVEDIIKNAGPLTGLYSGLYHSKTENNLVISCDVPLINTSVLKKLIKGFEDDKEVIQIQSQDKTMPLIALYKKQCLHKCLELLQNNERRLRVAVKQFKTKTVTLDSNLDSFVRNINTINQLEALKHELEH